MKRKILKIFLEIALAITIIFVFTNQNSVSLANQKEEVLTEKQQALLEVAHAFLDKGESIQYDSGNMFQMVSPNTGKTIISDSRLNRQMYPEQATNNDKDYLVCSGFTYAVYEKALGIELPIITDYLMDEIVKNKDNKEYVPIYEEPSDNTNLQELVDTLQVGDIIVTRSIKDTGHAMLYVGDNKIIHSIGSKYDFKKGVDIKEDNGTVLMDNVWQTLTNKDNTFYLLRKDAKGEYLQEKYAILRPLATEEGKNAQLTEYVKNRLNYPGIVIENQSSVITKQSVNIGDKIEYKIKVANNGKDAYKNVPVETQLSEYLNIDKNTISDSGKLDNGKISWTISELKPNQTIYLTYKVDVKKETNTLGKTIESKAKVGNIETNTLKNEIKSTLTQEEQTAFLQTAYMYYVQSQKGYVQYVSGVQNFENETLQPEDANSDNIIKFNQSGLINGIYKYTFQVDPNIYTTEDTINKVFSEGTFNSEDVYKLRDEDNDIRKMLVSDLFGGTIVKLNIGQQRTKNLESYYLNVGDIIVSRYDNNGSEIGSICLYIGDNTIITMSQTKGIVLKNANSEMEKLLSHKKFTILRPSYVLENRNITDEVQQRENLITEQEKEDINKEIQNNKVIEITFSNRINNIVNRYAFNKNLKYSNQNIEYKAIPENAVNIDEAGFVYGTYYNAFGIKLPQTVSGLINNQEMKVENISYKDIKVQNLQKGDIIAYTYKDENGNEKSMAEIYIGNSKIMRFTQENKFESFPVSIEYKNLENIGDKIQDFSVLRPSLQYNLQDSIINWTQYEEEVYGSYDDKKDDNNGNDNKEENKNETNNNTGDNTISNNILPNAGIIKTIFIVGFISMIIISYIFYKKYKDLPKNM